MGWVAPSKAVEACQFGDAVWHADSLAGHEGEVVASGHALLDAQLPGGGWPVGALCEVLQSHCAQGEWRLLLPALCAAQQAFSTSSSTSAAKKPSVSNTWVALIAPPHTPFGPALAAQGLDVSRLLWIKAQSASERLWATEQALRCADVAAVLAWLPQVQSTHLRRLHMAAGSHAKLLFVMRPASAQHESSPAVLRLLLNPPARVLHIVAEAPATEPNPNALHLQLLKRRGPPLAQTLVLPALWSGHALDRLAA